MPLKRNIYSAKVKTKSVKVKATNSPYDSDIKESKKDTTKHKAYLQMNSKKLDSNTRKQATDIIKKQESRIASMTKQAKQASRNAKLDDPVLRPKKKKK